MASLDEHKKAQARALLMKARIYRFFAGAFALTGLIVFITIYSKNVDGDLLQMLKNPALLTVILVPFMPAAVLSWLSVRAEEKFLGLLQENGAKKD